MITDRTVVFKERTRVPVTRWLSREEETSRNADWKQYLMSLWLVNSSLSNVRLHSSGVVFSLIACGIYVRSFISYAHSWIEISLTPSCEVLFSLNISGHGALHEFTCTGSRPFWYYVIRLQLCWLRYHCEVDYSTVLCLDDDCRQTRRQVDVAEAVSVPVSLRIKGGMFHCRNQYNLLTKRQQRN